MHEDILLTLADRLPDDFLRDCFPEEDPGRIRETLRRLGRHPGGNCGPDAAENNGDSQPYRLKPDSIRCILYTDGASRGNPGEAGAGLVVLDENRRELAARSLYLGRCTNNGAEYRALIAGLELVHELGCRSVDILMDSELIVRQVNGQYKVKNAELQPLHLRVSNLLGRLEEWRIRHVPRAENVRADQLANQGIDNSR